MLQPVKLESKVGAGLSVKALPHESLIPGCRGRASDRAREGQTCKKEEEEGALLVPVCVWVLRYRGTHNGLVISFPPIGALKRRPVHSRIKHFPALTKCMLYLYRTFFSLYITYITSWPSLQKFIFIILSLLFNRC